MAAIYRKPRAVVASGPGNPARLRLLVPLGMETAVALVASIYLAQSQAVSPALALMLALVPLAATLIGVILPRWVPVSRLRLLPTAVALNLIGLLILSVTARSFAQLQCFWSFVSLGAYCAVVLWASSQDRLRRLAPPLFVVALGLVVLTLFIGVSPSGGPQKQWLPVGPYYFEPSELLKLSLTLLLALSLAGQAPSRRNPWSLAAIGASLAALAVQGDLGAAFVVAGVGALMLYAGTGHWKRLALGAAVLVAAGAAAYLLVPYARPRFNTWLDPWSDPTGASYQVVQSVRALATGGALGRGLLTAESLHVPASHTDSIIAPIGERLGLMGTLATVSLYGILLAQIRRIYLRAPSRLDALVATGVAALLVGQAIVIAGGTTGLLPLTGVTLPLVSYGGSSLLTCYLALGMVGGRNGDLPTPTAGPQRRSHDVVHLGLAVALVILGLWLSAWHLAGTAMIAHFTG